MQEENDLRWEVSDGESLSPTTYVPTITANFPPFPDARFVASKKKFPMQEEASTNTQNDTMNEDIQNMMKKVSMLELDDSIPDKFDHVIEAIAVSNKVLRIAIKLEKFEEFVDMKMKVERMSNYMAMELGAKEKGVTTKEIPLDMRTAAVMRSLGNCYATIAVLDRKMADYYGLLASGLLQKIKEDEEKQSANTPD